MSFQEEILEAKLATMIEPYKKVGIYTDDCTLNGLSSFCTVEQFVKIQKFLHHLVRQEIFPQLMARAFVKGIISSAGCLTANDIWNINTWLRTKEGQTAIQDQLNIRKSKRKAAKRTRKSKRKAAKRLHKEMSYSGNEMERMVDENFRKMGRMVDEQFRKMGERADAQDKALADLGKMLQSLDCHLVQQLEEIQEIIA